MGMSGPSPVSPKRQRIAWLAWNAPDMVFTSLAHHIDIDWLREAWERTRKDGAPGVDGKDAREYARNLDANLRHLLERFKSGLYRAPPVRRVHIPKGDGRRTRPIGIPTIEDKVLQRAVTMVLEVVYEQDFLDCSYGFRPGRSAHGALADLRAGLMEMHGGWIVDVDIEGFFDAISHEHLRAFLDRRVRDGVIRRAIGKWLNAGVLDGGVLSHPDSGTPQGGVISPLLANIYLHEVVDRWFVEAVRPRLRGAAFLIRYADDLMIVCGHEADAERIMDVLPKRLGRFGLRMHPEKTRLVRFVRPPYQGTPKCGDRPETFDFLGFTHYWGRARTRRRGWVVQQKTAKDRFTRTLRRIAATCRRMRHLPLRGQQRVLDRMLAGHDAYVGRIGNSKALGRLRFEVQRIWRKWLDRRGGKRRMTWERFTRLLVRFPLRPARVVHSAPVRGVT